MSNTRARVVSVSGGEHTSVCEPWLLTTSMNDNPRHFPGMKRNTFMETLVTNGTEPVPAQPSKFELVSYGTKDRHDLPSSAYTFIVPDFLIKGGITLLSGDPKAGKSTIAKNLAYSVATGKPFLGRTVEQGFVYYILLDDSPGWTLKTLVLMNDRDDIDDMQVTDRVGFDPAHYMQHLHAVLSKYPETKLIVIDTLSKSLPLDNINDYKPVEQGINNMARFAHQTRVSLLLLHHAAKDDSRGDIKAHMGSQAFSAGVDIPLVVRKKGTDQGTVSGVAYIWPI